MPTYEVRIYETLMHTVTVQAPDTASAHELAYDMVMNDTDNLYDTESCGTSDDYDIMEVK